MADFTILWRNKSGEEWKVAETTNYADEAELQKLLYKNPSIVPIQELSSQESAFAVAIREAGLGGAGSSDLILVNPRGTIGVVECKLATNSDIRRKVIGQVLEYAAALWQMSYDDFNEICQKRENQSLDKLMNDKASPEEWEEESFRQVVEENLAQGRLLLIIAVDVVNPELERIIEYMNRTGVSGIQIAALELRLMKEKGIEILVPRLIGPMPTEAPPPPPEPRFLEACEKTGGPIGQAMKNTYEFAKQHADYIGWGKALVPGYVARIMYDNKYRTLFAANANGWFEIHKFIINKHIDPKICDWFVGELKKIDAFRNLNWELKYPEVKLHAATQQPKETMDAFCKLFAELVNKIRALSKNTTGG